MNLADRIEANEKEERELLRAVQISALWKAIERYIEKAEVNKCALMDKKNELFYHRGQGAIRLKNICAYPIGAGEEAKNTVRFFFYVSMNDEDYDEVRELYCMIDAPVSLLHEFDQEKFDKWILTKDAELRKRKLADAKEKLKTLLDEFPELKNWN